MGAGDHPRSGKASPLTKEASKKGYSK